MIVTATALGNAIRAVTIRSWPIVPISISANATDDMRPIPAGGGRPLSGKLVLKSRATKSRSFPMDFFECQIPAALLAQDAHVL